MATFTDNTEAITAWDGPLFDRFVQFRHLLVDNLAQFGLEAMRVHPPKPGERLLDIGCGFGDMTQQLAGLVGPEGLVVGVDAAPRFVEASREDADANGVTNVRFEVADVETTDFDETYDAAYSRFGTMFFANPVAALRRVRAALRPGGRLVMVVWRAKVENDWVMRTQTITERFVTKPEEYDEPTCGPGPFAMGNADTTTGILAAAGFEAITLRRVDLPIKVGGDVDEAASFAMSLGPAGEILRLAGDSAAHLHPQVAAAIREGIADWVRPDGVFGAASVWIVSAEAPAG